jgi:hypothetical protein
MLRNSRHQKKLLYNLFQNQKSITCSIMLAETVEGYGGSTLQKSGYDRAFL